MNRLAVALVSFVVVLHAWRAGAMFVRRELERVPVGRLLTNLHQRLAQNTNDFDLTYQLARVYSMAYATNLIEVPVEERSGRPVFYPPGEDRGVPGAVRPFANAEAKAKAFQSLTNAIAHYQRALVVLKTLTNADERRWWVAPTQLGLAWCLDQSGQRTLALAEYRRALAVAWRLEVTGDFQFNRWAEEVWDDVRTGRNPFRSHQPNYLGPGVCYSEEVIHHLLKLLDPEKDAREIADLNRRNETLGKMGRAITPILIPLEAGIGLADLINLQARVAFDLDGSGLPRSWGWITPKAAWLVYDATGRGEITSGLQLIGAVTFWVFWRDGYAALAALDDNGDQALAGGELACLALWHDANGNGLSEPGEVRSLADFGITRIACTGEKLSADALWNPHGVTFKDGSTRPSYDWTSPSGPQLR